MEEHSKISFELILQPSLLHEKLLCRKNEPLSMSVMQDFLVQLQTWSPDSGLKRKRANMQAVVLSIFAHYSWDLELIRSRLPLHLQSQLMDCVLHSCTAQQILTRYRELIDAGEALPLDEVPQADAIFAMQLYFRWIVRTVPALGEPIPPVNKIQLYQASLNSLAACGVPEIGLVNQVNSLRATAVRTLETLIAGDQLHQLLIPSQHCFKVNQNSLEVDCMLPEESAGVAWIASVDRACLAVAQFDLIVYYFYTEQYLNCRHNVDSLIGNFNESLLKRNVDLEMLQGIKVSVYPEQPDAQGTEHASLDRAVNQELAAFYHRREAAATDLGQANLSDRLQHNLSPNFEFFRKTLAFSPPSDTPTFKASFLSYLSNPAPLMDYYKQHKPKLASDKNWSKSSAGGKNPSCRRRDSLLNLLRERRPEKISKALADATKFKGAVSRAGIVRWQIDEMMEVLLSMATSAANVDAQLLFVLLTKMKQMMSLKSYPDVMALFNAFARCCAPDKQQPLLQLRLDMDPNPVLKQAYLQSLHAKMVAFAELGHLPGMDTEPDSKQLAEFIGQCRECYFHLSVSLSPNDVVGFIIMEELVSTLINLAQFEFLLERGSDKRWNLVQLACQLCSYALHYRSKLQIDFKSAQRSLADILVHTAMGSVGGGAMSKRSRADASGQGSSLAAKQELDKQWIVAFIRRLRHPEVTVIVAAYYVSCYNAVVNDTVREIVCDLPTVTVVPHSSHNLNQDVILSMILEVAANTNDSHRLPWPRLKAEVHFSRGNYRTSLQHYLETLIVATNFFIKPWSQNGGQDFGWDERIFPKMIKCTSELGQHLQAAVLCQFLSDVDYPTAFRSLEERSSNDAMDKLYQFIWDVTILEFAVSMHAKRGEILRKNRALEAISHLEVNTNNNEEILREARASRRNAFLRYMAKLYL